MWSLTLACGFLFLLSAENSAVMCGAWPRILVTSPWLRFSMIYCWALRLWSQICVYVSKLLVPGFGRCLVVPGQDASCPRDVRIRTRWVRNISPTQIWVWLLQNWFFGCVVWDRTFMCSVQWSLYISCIMSCGNKIVSKLFQIVSKKLCFKLFQKIVSVFTITLT